MTGQTIGELTHEPLTDRTLGMTPWDTTGISIGEDFGWKKSSKRRVGSEMLHQNRISREGSIVLQCRENRFRPDYPGGGLRITWCSLSVVTNVQP